MKRLWKFIGALALLMGAVHFANAANTCVPTDMWCYVSGPSQNTTTQARLDASGNLTLNGSATITGNESVSGNNTVSGKTIYPIQTVTGISTQTIGITPTASYMMLLSTGGAVVMTTTAVQIATATATNGQYVIIGSTSSVSTVTLTAGSAEGIRLGAATRVIDNLKRLTLIFDSFDSQWKEISYASDQ